MEDCCNHRQKPVNVVCPKNGKVCKPVPRITVETLVSPEHKRFFTAMPYSFCDSPDCDVVYVSASEEQVITKDQLRVRVGIKETEDPIPLCYCFDFDRKAICNDICSKGRTDIPRVIRERVRAGECRCEFTNPRGTCCLGDIDQAVKQAQT
jgi:Zinc binding domain